MISAAVSMVGQFALVHKMLSAIDKSEYIEKMEERLQQSADILKQLMVTGIETRAFGLHPNSEATDAYKLYKGVPLVDTFQLSNAITTKKISDRAAVSAGGLRGGRSGKAIFVGVRKTTKKHRPSTMRPNINGHTELTVYDLAAIMVNGFQVHPFGNKNATVTVPERDFVSRAWKIHEPTHKQIMIQSVKDVIDGFITGGNVTTGRSGPLTQGLPGRRFNPSRMRIPRSR